MLQDEAAEKNKQAQNSCEHVKRVLYVSQALKSRVPVSVPGED
jgi:hypothetical protein